MPMKKGTSRATVSENIEEFHHGPTYWKTREKHGKEVADRQAIAAAMETKRRSGGESKKSARKTQKRDLVRARGSRPGK